jgi:hypothetical protein
MSFLIGVVVGATAAKFWPEITAFVKAQWAKIKF